MNLITIESNGTSMKNYLKCPDFNLVCAFGTKLMLGLYLYIVGIPPLIGQIVNRNSSEAVPSYK